MEVDKGLWCVVWWMDLCLPNATPDEADNVKGQTHSSTTKPNLENIIETRMQNKTKKNHFCRAALQSSRFIVNKKKNQPTNFHADYPYISICSLI